MPCRYHGCNSAACVLCKHNPAKRCTGNFAHKYWVGDKLLAKCEGTIMVELIDAETGARMTDEVQGMKIEVRSLVKRLCWGSASACSRSLCIDMLPDDHVVRRIECCGMTAHHLMSLPDL